MKKEFIFSVSTNAFQIEGARSLGGRTDSIWDEFTKRNFYIPALGKAEREINSIEIAADFYHKYKTDCRIMDKLGLKGFVYNMDWTRIFPKDENYINPEGIKFYIDLFEELNKYGIKPIPILFHWDTPLWAEIRGGFENPEIIQWFKNYVECCFKYLGKYTDIWFVNDENSSFAQSGYITGDFPPGKKDKTAFVKVLHNLNMSAAVTMEEFKKAKDKGLLSKESILGIDHDWSPPVPYTDSKEDIEACEKYNEWWKDLYLDPNLKGEYPKVFLEFIKDNKIDVTFSKEDLQYLKNNKLDFIGWNYYRPIYVTANDFEYDETKFISPLSKTHLKNVNFVQPIEKKYTKWKWPVDNTKLVEGAKRLSKDYGKNIPIMIIENGFGDFDDKSKDLILDWDRIEYLKDHIQETLRAKEEGVNMIGYSLWTYCDIFSPSGGYRKDYGLVSVDFNSPIRERKPKASFAWYKKIIENEGKELEYSQSEIISDLTGILKDWDIFYK
ncbi:glycoside hydrolase family 1 protein [Mesoplasma florum]|uniref:glycoside hydrolase family 1 protein n=1 Tax=Mesoplasma florum TaxID=2151 RepID=UPI000D03BDC1|nr:family 1 glycosylhydrolase [Mesoplasma florum]AVN58906.1 aryl-phospho-beta-d-glucosidase [Mesoplasma florum]